MKNRDFRLISRFISKTMDMVTMEYYATDL